MLTTLPRPLFAELYPTDRSLLYPVVCGNVNLSVTGTKSIKYCGNIRHLDLGSTVRISPRHSPLAHGVCRVFCRCPEEKMRRVYAPPHVTFVADVQAVFNRPVVNLVRKTMGRNRVRLSVWNTTARVKKHDPVPVVSVARTGPQPASVRPGGFVHLRPESFLYRDSRVHSARHRQFTPACGRESRSRDNAGGSRHLMYHTRTGIY